MFQAAVPAHYEYAREVPRLAGHGDDAVADLHGLKGLPRIGKNELGLPRPIFLFEVGVVPRCLQSQPRALQAAV